jgi:hypothetical protein
MTAPYPPTIENPFDAIQRAMIESNRHWEARDSDAWLFAIVIGWSEEALAEVAVRHRWPPLLLARLRRLRAAYEDARLRQSEGFLRTLIDLTWQEATESQQVPSERLQNKLISRARLAVNPVPETPPDAGVQWEGTFGGFDEP